MSFHRRHWVIAAAVVLLAIGGYWTYLFWGAWGPFVACSVLTLAGASAPAFLLLPRLRATLWLFLRLMSCSLWLMLIGWGLVALFHPAYAIGWYLPAKGTQGLDIRDESDALLAAWMLLSVGVFASVLIPVSAVRTYPDEVRREREPAPRPFDPMSGNPAIRNAGGELPVTRRLRKTRDQQRRLR